MDQKENDRRSEFPSRNVTPDRLLTPHKDRGFAKRSVMAQDVNRTIQCTTCNSPYGYAKTPQSSGSYKKDVRSLLESNKRKIETPHNESREKVQRTSSSGKFVNTMIGQWSKHMGMQSLLSQAEESPIEQETKHKHMTEERIIQKLQKKLQIAEETISSLSASIEAEMRAKAEILQHLDSDWESITKYYYEISESLKDFRKHKDNLSALYKDVIIVQQSTVKNLQQELSSMRLKDENQGNVVSTLENKIMDQEKRIKEMMLVEAEIKQHLDDIKKEAVLEKNRLHDVHAEEKLELLKKQENLTSINAELQAELKKTREKEQYVSNILREKDEKLSKVEKEILVCQNKLVDLTQQNNDLNAEYTKLLTREEELSKALQLRTQEIGRLQENLSARQEIESSLAKDLDIIDNKYKNMQNNFENVNNVFQETQIRNINLEKSLEEVKLQKEHKITELNRKIDLLQQEKERLVSENQKRIKELENSCKVLKEKHKSEIALLKAEFDAKISEMTNTIVTQRSAFAKLNETLSKIKKNRINDAKYYHHPQENQDILQVGVQDVKFNEAKVTTKVTEEIQSEMNQIHQTQKQPVQNHDIVDKWKNKFENNTVGSNVDQAVYSFNPMKINNELQNISSPRKGDKSTDEGSNSLVQNTDSSKNYSYLSQNKKTMRSTPRTEEKDDKVKNDTPANKKIFKTRNSGLRQYGTSKKCQYGTQEKTSKK